MAKEDPSVFQNIKDLLQRDYRGINIAVYAVATAGLAVAIYKIRPVSKFSKASKVPEHFFRDHVQLNGVCAGAQQSPPRFLVHHRAPIPLPLWHSSKPPLPVKIWGVDIVSGNAVSWIECVAKGHQVTLKPIAKDKEDLVSTVVLHLSRPEIKTVETIDVGQKLVELGFAQTCVPKEIKKKTLESNLAPALLSAEAHAKSYRNGIWLDKLPPIPLYVIYWRKATKVGGEVLVLGGKQLYEVLVLAGKQLYRVIIFATKSALIATKNLALKPFRKSVSTQISIK